MTNPRRSVLMTASPLIPRAASEAVTCARSAPGSAVLVARSSARLASSENSMKPRTKASVSSSPSSDRPPSALATAMPRYQSTDAERIAATRVYSASPPCSRITSPRRRPRKRMSGFARAAFHCADAAAHKHIGQPALRTEAAESTIWTRRRRTGSPGSFRTGISGCLWRVADDPPPPLQSAATCRFRPVDAC